MYELLLPDSKSNPFRLRTLNKMRMECYFECTDNGKLYSFPKKEERFQAWKAVLHPLAHKFTKEYITSYFRLCYRHFEDCYILRSQRLTINAVPTLNLIQYGGDGNPNIDTNFRKDDLVAENISQHKEKIKVEVTEDEDYEAISVYDENIPNISMNDINRMIERVPQIKEEMLEFEIEILNDKEIGVDEEISDVKQTENDFEMGEIKPEILDENDNLFEIMVESEERNYQCKHIYNIKTILECTNATLIRSHNNLGYECFFCDKCYVNPSQLKEHATNTHTIIDKDDLKITNDVYVAKLDVTGLYCKPCYRYIDTLQNLASHLNEVHDKNLFLDIKNQIVPLIFNKGMPSCCVCFKTCESFRGLVLHLLVHYKKYLWKKSDSSFIDMEKIHDNFPCSYCPKIFRDVHNKTDHENQVHRDKILRFKCEKCNKKFRLFAHKKNHMLNAHNLTTKEKKRGKP